MKKIKVLSIIITLIMVLNIIAPATFAISENLTNQQQGADYVRSFNCIGKIEDFDYTRIIN